MEKETKWTLFWDMHSGGTTKQEPYEKIYIEAPELEAKIIFVNRFGHHPEAVYCECCGENYSIEESDSLGKITAYFRGCRFDEKTNTFVEHPSAFHKFKTLEEYEKQEDVLIIRSNEIKDSERVTTY